MDFLSLATSRRSLRRYTERPVSVDLIQQVLTAGHWAPSAHNRQPWRFCVIQSVDNKHKLAKGMGARLQADLQAAFVPAAVIQKDVQRSYERITGAPVLILLALSMIDMDHYPDEVRSNNEYLMAVQSTAMAGQNILLNAHALGLAACWMCAPLFCQDVVQEILSLPADWQAQALITMGYPAQDRSRSRKPLSEVMMWR